MRAGGLSEEDRLQALTTPMRDLFDALRMIVHRAETPLAGALASGLSRPETARTLVKAMLSNDAGIVPDQSAETLTVRLLHQGRRGHALALVSLMEELSRTRTLYLGDQSAPGLRDPPARSRRHVGVFGRLCRPVPAGRKSDTARLIDVRNSAPGTSAALRTLRSSSSTC